MFVSQRLVLPLIIHALPPKTTRQICQILSPLTPTSPPKKEVGRVILTLANETCRQQNVQQWMVVGCGSFQNAISATSAMDVCRQDERAADGNEPATNVIMWTVGGPDEVDSIGRVVDR